MAGKIQSPADLAKVQDYVRENAASLTQAQLQELHSEVQDFQARATAAPAPEASAPPPGPDGMSTPPLTPQDMAVAQANAEAFQRGVTDKGHKVVDLVSKPVRTPDENLGAAIEELKRGREQAKAAAIAPEGASPRGFYGAGDIAPDVLAGGLGGLGRGVIGRAVGGA